VSVSIKIFLTACRANGFLLPVYQTSTHSPNSITIAFNHPLIRSQYGNYSHLMTRFPTMLVL